MRPIRPHTVVEDAIDKGGEPILGADGKPLTRRYQRLKLFSEPEPSTAC
jgi:hypothetical protein